MQIWVDVDNCPVEIKNILTAASKRTGVSLTVISRYNQFLNCEGNINSIELPCEGIKLAEKEMAEKSKVGDLVITDDVSLASEVLGKGAKALGYKGEKYTIAEIEQKKKMNEYMDMMLAAGVEIGRQPPISTGDKQNFIQSLESFLISY